MPTVRETLGLDTNSRLDGAGELQAETGEVQEEQTGPDRITVHLGGQGMLDKVSISATTARLMLIILNSMPVQGGAMKIQIGVAQQELEQVLQALEAANPRIKNYPFRPATRAERRRASK